MVINEDDDIMDTLSDTVMQRCRYELLRPTSSSGKVGVSTSAPQARASKKRLLTMPRRSCSHPTQPMTWQQTCEMEVEG